MSTKFRDELRPRYGLLRSREFMMKDMYSFDCSRIKAIETYNRVCDAYDQLLSSLRLPHHKVIADSGSIGGNLSHEFHIPLSIGEDTLKVCSKCGTGYNIELEGSPDVDNLDQSKCTHTYEKMNGIEVGHCFLLGQRYSSCLNATFESNGVKRPMEMGCYGIGLTRLLAASVEYLVTSQKPDLDELRWPNGLAPFSGAIALQKETAQDALNPSQLETLLTNLITEHGSTPMPFTGDILIDDREGMSLGRKLVDLKRLGIPWILIAKSHSAPAFYELIDVYKNQSFKARLTDASRALFNSETFGETPLQPWIKPDPRQR